MCVCVYALCLCMVCVCVSVCVCVWYMNVDVHTYVCAVYMLCWSLIINTSDLMMCLHPVNLISLECLSTAGIIHYVS